MIESILQKEKLTIVDLEKCKYILRKDWGLHINYDLYIDMDRYYYYKPLIQEEIWFIGEGEDNPYNFAKGCIEKKFNKIDWRVSRPKVFPLLNKIQLWGITYEEFLLASILCCYYYLINKRLTTKKIKFFLKKID